MFVRIRTALAIATLVALVFAMPERVRSQAGIMLFGNSGGVATAVTATSAGLLNVTVGGGTSTVDITTDSTHGFCFSTRGCIKATADGTVNLLNNAGTGWSLLCFGPCTSSNPAVRRTSNTMADMRVGDNSAGADFGAFHYFLNGVLTLSGNPVTVSSGFGTSPAVTGATSAAFRLNVGTGGAASTGVLNMGNTATNGWNCPTADVTTPDTFVTVQTASTTTTASFKNYSRTTGLAIAWTASDVLAISCVAF